MLDFLFHKKKHYPKWLRKYLALNFKDPGGRILDEAQFVTLDCETTGMSSSDQIITIGAVKNTWKEIFLNKVLDQKYPVLQAGKSAEIHGELSEHINEDKSALLKSLVKYLGNHIIVGHNIAFDIRMINNELKKTFNVTLKNKVIDTAHLVMRIDPVKYERTVGGNTNLHLDDLCKEYSIPVENRHTALGDAYMTAQLLQRLLVKLKRRGISKAQSLVS